MSTFDRPALATQFVAALRDASLRNPTSWRRVSAISARTGITSAQLEQVVDDTGTGGLMEQHVDDAGLVILTDKGWAATNNQKKPACGSGQIGRGVDADQWHWVSSTDFAVTASGS